MRKHFIIFFCIAGFVSLPSLTFATSSKAKHKNILFQVGTFSSLMQGVFDGDCTYEKLMQHGDFRLGTFNGLDGEMVAIDGKFYQFQSSGKLVPVTPDLIAPFAEVVFFKPSMHKELKSIRSVEDLHDILVKILPNKNIPYAIRIDGEFTTIKMRNFYKQRKPYPLIEKAVQEQEVFNLQHVTGSMIGFWFPDYWNGIAVPGIHMHFVTTDRKKGGHMLEFAITKAKMSIAPIQQLTFNLPATKSFAQAHLTPENECAAIKKIEGAGSGK